MISQQDLLRYQPQSAELSSANARLALQSGRQTAFLCHSHHDAELAGRLQSFLQNQGWLVYIDWQDTSMPAIPSAETAVKIRQRIRLLDWFLFLATQNSVSSRWCPWEIGYADGTKNNSDIVVIPTVDQQNRFYGNEYLNLYRSLQYTQFNRQLVECVTPGLTYTTGLRSMQPTRNPTAR